MLFILNILSTHLVRNVFITVGSEYRIKFFLPVCLCHSHVKPAPHVAPPLLQPPVDWRSGAHGPHGTGAPPPLPRTQTWPTRTRRPSLPPRPERLSRCPNPPRRALQVRHALLHHHYTLSVLPLLVWISLYTALCVPHSMYRSSNFTLMVFFLKGTDVFWLSSPQSKLCKS